MDEEDQSKFNAGLTMATLKRKKNTIGSVYNAAMNYPKDQKFFHANDVPEIAKEAARDMKDAIDKDIFKLKRPKWNASVSKAKEIRDDNDEINLFEIRKGFKDFCPLQSKSTKIYDGTDTRNDLTRWNVSNQVPIALHQEKMRAEK
jgi:hypothetical protein